MAHHHQSQGSHEEEVLGKAYDARLMRRLLAYLKPYRLQVVIALVAIVLKAGADVLGPYLTKVAIDKYLAHKPGAGHSFLDRFLSSQPLTGIAQIGMAYIALLSFSFLLEFAQTYLMQWTGQKVMFDLRSQIYRHLQQMHVAFFDRNPVGRLVTRVTTDVDALNEMFTAGVVSIFEDVFVLAGIIAIMLNMSWQLALIAFAVLPLIYIGTAIFRKHVRDSYRRIRVAIARINAYLQEHITGIVPLQLFNREEKAFAEFKAINATHMLAFKDAIMAYSLYYPMVEILSATAVASIIWYGGHRILAGTITLGVLVAFMQYAQRFFRPIQDLSEKYNILQSAMASSERIFKMLDTKPEIASLPGARLPDGPGHIEFEHVWFAYRRIPLEDPKRSGAEPKLYPQVSAEQPKELLATGGTASQAVPIVSKEFLGGAEPGAPVTGGWDWVLRDVSFTVKPGETAAVVGHTGAGKTTLISLLLRFYDVQQGAIRLDGVDIRQLDLQALRRKFGVVLQDPFLFSGTIESNIRLGSDDVDLAAVERAAEEVNLSEFIRSLPEGFQSHTKERGSTLSTGQKQLISFARALAHNPRILILDEATSSVDTDTEFRVREALSRMVEGRTSLIIAHRLSTIQRADNIIVMHKGKVREMGTHQQLLAQRGIYYKLYQLQYRDQELASVPVPPPLETPREVGAGDD
ncbi:MAG: ABC transporter transmembrane domain-containing protein [Candidatus Korobacteraceae bacterium]|jgi:ATP-binding cassette subfamily B protein